MLKCLVTGGAGFIGGHVVDALLERNFSVTVLDNLSSGRVENINHILNNKNFRLVELDLRDKVKVEKLILKEKPDYIFHLAAQMNVRESVKDPQNDADVNIIGLLNLLEACRKINL